MRARVADLAVHDVMTVVERDRDLTDGTHRSDVDPLRVHAIVAVAVGEVDREAQ